MHFTGMVSQNIMRVNVWPYSSCGLPASEITYAEQAKKAGYTTALFGMRLIFHDDLLAFNCFTRLV